MLIILACLIIGFAVELYLLYDLNKRLESLEAAVEDLYNDVYEDEEDVHDDYEE